MVEYGAMLRLPFDYAQGGALSTSQTRLFHPTFVHLPGGSRAQPGRVR